MASTKVPIELSSTPGIVDNSNATAITIDSSENVGIGTSSPADRLHLVDNSSNNFSTTLRLGQTYNSVYSTIGSNFGGAMTINAGQGGGTPSLNIQVNGSERMRITTSGELMLNTTSNPNTLNSSGQLNMVCSTGDGVNIKHTNNGFNLLNLWQTGTSTFNAIGFYKGNTQTTVGLITCTTSATSYNTSSDYRLKENIQPLANGLERVQQLNPVQFDWKESGETSEGFIAHEVQEIFNDAVVGEKDGEDMQVMDYGRITPLLVKAIQEQQVLIEQLQAEVALLKGE